MKFLKSLHQNKYLVGVDMRGNKGYSDHDVVKSALGHYLQRNLNLNMAQDVKLKSSWIIKEEIFPEIQSLVDQDNEPQLALEILDLHNSYTARQLYQKLNMSEVIGGRKIKKGNNHSPKHKNTSQDLPHYAICDISA